MCPWVPRTCSAPKATGCVGVAGSGPSPGEEGACRAWRRAETPPLQTSGGFLLIVLRKGCLVSRPPHPRHPLETELTSKGPDSKPSVNPDPSPHPWGLTPSLPDGVGSLFFQGPRPRLGSVWRGHSPLNRDPELEKHWKEEALAVCSTSAKAAPHPLPGGLSQSLALDPEGRSTVSHPACS